MTKPRSVVMRFVLLAAMALPLTACMINAPPSRGGIGAQELLPNAGMPLKVEQVFVTVPRSLVVSEANTVKPAADIVWHGEARGDRHAQVQRIAQDAMALGAAPYQSGYPIVIDVQIVRFHAQTPMNRSIIGGEHELEYVLTMRDAKTGKVLRQVAPVDATVKAPSGMRARSEDAVGRTQAVVIREALAASLQRELIRAGQVFNQSAAVARAAGAPSAATLH